MVSIKYPFICQDVNFSPGNFLVDISINQTNGITAGQIINKFVTYHPALKPLVLVVKAFLSQRAMNEVFSGGLGSYSIVCMALSFLQVRCDGILLRYVR